jgi:hypothetical protein
MRGEWITRFARLLLHEDTFELMVAPAIADLQVDNRLEAYLPVWTSLLYCWATDLHGDVRLVFDDLGTLAGLTLIQASYYSAMLLLLVAGRSGKEVIQVLLDGGTPQFFVCAALVVSFSTLPTLLCFWPPRRELQPD